MPWFMRCGSGRGVTAPARVCARSCRGSSSLPVRALALVATYFTVCLAASHVWAAPPPGVVLPDGPPPLKAEAVRLMDCKKDPNPAYCNKINDAHEACKGEAGLDFKRCMHKRLPGPPPQDCKMFTAKERGSCERHNAALASCGSKLGEDNVACLRATLSASPAQ